jgi:hypothetical protein
MIFRPLKETEIMCRVGKVTEYNVELLLYKNARIDMDLLDEIVGADNWQRRYNPETGVTTVLVRCKHEDGTFEWIPKEDIGTESYAEAEKGKSSDSFKRACVNWGIGRELYTAPEILIWAKDSKTNVENVKIEPKNNKFTTYDKFYVEAIKYSDDNKRIIALAIKNRRTERRVFLWQAPEEKK